MGGDVFFRNWGGLARAAPGGVLADDALVLLPRVAGRRTLSR
jgi:hypothetical protein